MSSDEPKGKSGKGFEGTMVDLGEDLLEITKAGARPASESAPAKPGAHPTAAPAAGGFDLAEELQHGEILYAEKLFDDAKKIFRKILRKAPGNAKATKLLDEIQKIEIQELLGGEAARKRLGIRDEGEDDPALVIASLEKDLFFNLVKAEIQPVPDLFENQETYERYKKRLLETTGEMTARDRIDVGVAHLEMGLYDVAQTVFETVVRNDESKLAGMYLLGLALIYGGKAIEATIRLEPLCRDLTLAESTKADFLYLMGLSFEHLNDKRKAREFYRRVHHLNPRYRDVPEKLK